MSDAARKVYQVTELTRLIKAALEREIGAVWVEGELSNVRRPSSGHYYFTVKDAASQLSAVLFRGDQGRLTFELKDGTRVRVFGNVSVYERGGQYQIIVRRMEETGKGTLQARFEALKEKLKGEGLFEDARKKRLPLLPRHLGIVTSPTGAAIRDILNVVTRRFPNVHVLLAPVKVQGEGAAEEIAAAVDLLNRRADLDVLIVARGGGSLEDLWCFNEEVVARAIARSRLPVIAAVGHEVDFTISDFVADLRAPTPSAAAELVVGRKERFEEELAGSARRIQTAAQQCVRLAAHRFRVVEKSYVFREPQNLVSQSLQRLDSMELRMAAACAARMRKVPQRIADVKVRMRHAIGLRLREAGHALGRIGAQLKAYNPLAVLDRGYSITRDRAGRIVRRATELGKGDRVRTRVAVGSFEAEVREIEKGTSGPS